MHALAEKALKEASKPALNRWAVSRACDAYRETLAKEVATGEDGDDIEALDDEDIFVDAFITGVRTYFTSIRQPSPARLKLRLSALALIDDADLPRHFGDRELTAALGLILTKPESLDNPASFVQGYKVFILTLQLNGTAFMYENQELNRWALNKAFSRYKDEIDNCGGDRSDLEGELDFADYFVYAFSNGVNAYFNSTGTYSGFDQDALESLGVALVDSDLPRVFGRAELTTAIRVLLDNPELVDQPEQFAKDFRVYDFERQMSGVKFQKTLGELSLDDIKKFHAEK